MSPICSVCQKPDTTQSPLKKCGKCKEVFYCTTDCQKSDWPKHKRSCGKEWYDSDKYRRCEDGALHEGKLELVTWNTAADPDGDFSEEMGWGAVIGEEGEDLKKKFETEFGSDEKKLFEYWPMAFRWTCCGTAGDQLFGCDHHGNGTKPCSCDVCKMGKPLTQEIYDGRCKSVHGKGLDLPRGPDPRSFNAETREFNEMMRKLVGMDP